LDQHGARTLLAPWDGTRGSESGCDARRLSTGRSIRAWRTLCWRQMTRNAGALASETLVPWLDGPRSRGRSKRLLRSRRRVGGSRDGVCRPPPTVVQERRERAAKGSSEQKGFLHSERALTRRDNARYPIRAFWRDGIGRQKEISARGRASPMRGVVGWESVWRKVERLGRTIIPARLSGPPRRLKSHRDFVWPKARPVELD
jgi:hypothetical protein